MAEAGIVVGPTLATIENTLGEPGGAAVVGDPRLAEALGDAWARRLTSDASGWHGRQMPPYSRAEDNVRRLADAGVTLLAGTDAPNPGTVFGASLHRELELLVRCGISPAQALAAATAEPARVFGLADRGRVAAGQRADLVLVSGDPLTDITATRAIERIWRGGIACDRHAFVASAAEAEQLDAFDAQLAKVVAAVRERWSNWSGGTTVTISGTNLASAADVDFAGERATVIKDTATSIKVTTPSNSAGLADVSVTTVWGTANDGGGYTYTTSEWATWGRAGQLRHDV